MSEITCTECGTKLRVNDPSPGGKFVQCPKCNNVFQAAEPKAERVAAEPLYTQVSCTNCGTVLKPPHPLPAGRLVHCLKCSTIFPVPRRLPSPRPPPEPAAPPPRPP